MRVITAPGVEITEIDKSQYSPAMTGTACYIMGFANKGEAYQPMEFTSRSAWVNYYGEPDNEAERYFYNACVETLNQNGRLYCARLPYDNKSFEKMVGYTYNLGTMSKINTLNQHKYAEITEVDKSIDNVCVIEGSNCPTMIDLEKVDEYRTDEEKVPQDQMLIVDKTCATYKKILEDSTRKNLSCELLGIVPVITTAANALYAQKLIDVADNNVKYYETIGDVFTQNGEAGFIKAGTIDEDDSHRTVDGQSSWDWEGNKDLVRQLNSTYKRYGIKFASLKDEVVIIDDLRKIINKIISEQLNNNITNTKISDALTISTNPDDTEILKDNITISECQIKTNELKDTLKNKWTQDPIFINKINDLNSCNVTEDDTIQQFANKIESLYSFYTMTVSIKPADGDDSLPYTVSMQANEYFPTIEFDPETSSFKRDHLKKIGVVVFKTYLNPQEGNKISFEPVEAFAGSLYKDDKDPNTGVTTFIDTIINNTSDYIYFFSNCFNTTASKKRYLDELDMLIARPTGNCATLGFYENQTVETISVSKSILDAMNKCFEKVTDINERNIDIVCDAGVSNIASFLKGVYGDASIPGYYDLNMTMDDGMTQAIKLWKCDSNNDAVKMWKSVVQKLDNFCKNTRKDCMFITECPRPLVLQGQKKIVRPSKPKNTIDSEILPYVKWVTGLNTNYGAGYMDWFEIADEYSGDFFWLPPSIKAMGSYIYTDVNFNYWDAPAGLTRGIIAATDVAFSPTPKQAGAIYEKNWNYAINYPNDGIILEGQKTFQVKPSAFDRVNVRRLFLRLERAAYQVARYFVYEGNTAYTRQRLVDALDPYFKEAKVGGGIYDYRIVCDESTNTPDVIDRNELKLKIGIKPVKTAEFILIDFIALTTGGSFEEAMG